MALQDGRIEGDSDKPARQSARKPRQKLAPTLRHFKLTALLDKTTSFVDLERDQWIIWIVIAFGAGAAFYFSLKTEPGIMIGPLALIAIGCLTFALPRHTLITATLGLALSLAAGFTAAKLKTEWVRAPVLKPSARAFDVTGLVEKVEPRVRAKVRLTIKPLSISGIPPDALPRAIRVTLSARMTTRLGDISSSDHVSLRARLSPPSKPALPGGHDFARYSWFQGIGAVGYAQTVPKRVSNSDAAPAGFSPRAWIKNIRTTISKRVTAVLPGETGAIANALITGERGAVPEATINAYRGAGLVHILSISGLHMAIMAGSVFFILRIFFALIPKIALQYPIKKWAAAGAILGGLAYLLISGGSFATIRSFIMITIMFIAILMDRPALALRNVAISALLILLIYPQSILNPGFQMSFAAVTALISGFEAMNRWAPPPDTHQYSAVRRWLLWPLLAIIMSTVIASAAVAPFAIYHFHNAQHYSVLANIIAMPACNLIVMPGALATLLAMPFGLEFLPLRFMGLGIDMMTQTANWVSSLPGATANPPALASHVFAIIIAGGLILMIVRQSFRLVGIAAISLGIVLAPGQTLPDILVGRDGNLIAIQTPFEKLAARMLSELPASNTPPKPSKQRAPYELSRWMEHFGDTRPPEAALVTRGIKCDSVGCTAKINGTLIAFPFHPAAMRQDCKRARILITNDKAPRTCTHPQTIIDKYAVRDFGTHAIYLNDDGTITITTVQETRGRRPWTGR